MKKKMLLALTGVAVVAAGCGTTATPKDDTTDKSDLSLEEVFAKSNARQSEIKSFNATMTMTQAMELGDGSTIDTSANMKMGAVLEPVQFFIDGTISMTEPVSNEKIDIPMKMYMTADDGFYMYESTADAWFKLPQDATLDEMLSQAGVQANAVDQLKLLEKFADDFTFEQTNTDYILTLKASGDKFKQLIEEQIALTMPDAPIDQLEELSFDDTSYQLTIDKKTYDMKELKLDMIISMEIEGTTAKIDQKTTTTYDDFNNTTITIPQDVLDNAQEINY
ncbi:hypothetical protein P9B03_00760 [Metasolibacillus meyeri]|uniref:Lipoprotein n=1 Tax=Metasolibacillus meyeri TaxID=1071052 RepID=A0AAW9NHU9_9BACL|nr:DUF6612 family protein [Metasolibacillus meyeri]MEC1177000.1 hypothetical protein [Metasolibacillus meyeri]